MKNKAHTSLKTFSKGNSSPEVDRFLKDVRDLLGFIRVENAVLSDEGHLSLQGLYMQKMVMLKDLEEKAAILAERDSSTLIDHGLGILSDVQKELQANTAQHIHALQNKTGRNTAIDFSEEGNTKCH